MMTSEDNLFEILRRPGIREMAELVRERYGLSALLTDDMSAFLRQHHWYLDEYMKELKRYHD
jgi:hypothetical protein